MRRVLLTALLCAVATLQEMGKTAEGRPQLMATVTAPANHRNLALLFNSNHASVVPAR